MVDIRRALCLRPRRGFLTGLFSNVNNVQALLQGRPEDAQSEVRYAWVAGVEIIGPECAVPPSTPTVNPAAVSDWARSCGPRQQDSPRSTLRTQR